MKSQKKNWSSYWNEIADGLAEGQPFDDLLAEQYRFVHMNLIDRWSIEIEGQRVLKTDLFAEALCPSRAFAWDIVNRRADFVGMDCSYHIVLQTKERTAKFAQNSTANFIVSDLRKLPFADNTFDIIVSDSSIDHFDIKSDIRVALSEFGRILKPGGTLFVTMDNRSNFTEPLFRLWLRLGLSSFFIGPTYNVRELSDTLKAVGLHVDTTTAIVHNPRFFTKVFILIMRKIHPTVFNGFIRKCLHCLDRLEYSGIKYITAQFIVAKAIKPKLDQ